MIDLLKIAKSILSDVILKDEREFKKYLEDHPDYREDTVFIVNGVKRIAPSKKKKSKRLTQKELKEVDNTLNGVFRALEEKGTDLEKMTFEKMKILHNIVNGVLEKSGISKLTEKQFVNMFNKKKIERQNERKKSRTMFGNDDEILKDLRGTGKRIVDDPIERFCSLNKKYKFQHGHCTSIFKPNYWDVDEQPLNEETTFKIDRVIGTNIVPPTIMTKNYIDNDLKEGSEQMFVDGAEGFVSTLQTKPDEFLRSEKTKNSMEKMAILDYLTNNTDRHMGNLMFDKNGNLFAIDHGMCNIFDDTTNKFRYYSCAFSYLKFLKKKGSSFYDFGDFYMSDGSSSEELEKLFKTFSKENKDLIKNIDIQKLKKLSNELSIKKGKDYNLNFLIQRAEKLKKMFERS